MKKFTCLLLLLVSVSLHAENELTLKVDLEPRLVYDNPQPFDLHLDIKDTIDMKVAPEALKVKAYKPLDDISWAGIPIFVAGIIAKGEKKAFRQDYNSRYANTRLLTSFKTHIDDYTQYFGPAMTLGLKIGGVEGRSQWGRMLVSAGLTYGIMAGLVNGIKYTSKELRPDGSTYNSWPSGHTATSFAGATILHKEYGLTRSPWYSVAGYGVATATGVMRVLNNRHWVSDVLSGAGIGIMSGELAYMISDLIFKDKYLLRNDMEAFPDLTRKPSFFSVSMGIGFGSHELDFSGLESETWEGITMDDLKLDFQMSTVVGAEGAYFFNRYVGVGGRLRVRTSPIKGWGQVLDYAEKDIQEHVEGWQELDSDGDFNVDGDVKTMLTDKAFSIESDHLTEFALDAGLYFSIPLSKRFAIGTKLLIGSSRMQALDLNAHFKGTVWNLDYSYDMRNGELKYETFSLDGMRQLLDDQGNPKTFETEWDYFTLEGNRSTKYGTGLSLTYAHKHNFSWRLFMDYDYTRKTYTLTKDSEHFMQYLMPNLVDLGGLSADIYTPEVYRMKKNMHQWVLGGAFCISF